MARDDRQDRQQRRARDDLDKGLKRSDCQLACSALLALAPDARTGSVAAVGRLVRRAARAHFSRQQWGELYRLSAHVMQEPSLLTLDAGADDVEETTWALLWAAIQGGRLNEATRWRDALGPRLPAPLAEALAALLEGAAAIPHELLAALGLDTAGEAERMGNEPTGGQAWLATPAAPATPAEARTALLGLAALRPPAALAAALRGWLPTLAPDVKGVALRLVADLMLRELLMRAAADDPRMPEAAALLGELVRHDALGLERHGVLGLRALASRLPREVADRSLARALLSIAGALALSVQQRDLVASVVAGVRFHDDLGPLVLPELEALLNDAPRVALWTTTARHWRSRTGPRTVASEPPTALTRALAALLDDGSFAASVTATADAGDVKRRMSTLGLVASTMPLALTERALDQCWQRAGREVRPQIAQAFQLLLERARIEAAAPPGGWRSVLQRETFGQLVERIEHRHYACGDDAGLFDILDEARERGLTQRQFEELSALVEQQAAAQLPAAVRPLWARWRDRMLPCHSRYLELALHDVESARDAVAVATEHLAERRDMSGWLEALGALGETSAAFGDAFLPVLLAHFETDVAALAQAVVRTVHYPRHARTVIVDAFLLAHGRGGALLTDDVERALAVAHALRKKPRARRKKKAATPKRTRRAKAPQDDLPF